MKARFNSNCSKCNEKIARGNEMVTLLGKWVHPECKAAHMAAVAETRTELPEHRGTADRPQWISSPGIRRDAAGHGKRANPRGVM